MKALVLENIHQSAVSVLESRGYEVDLRSGAMSEAELLHALEDVSLLGIRSNTTVSRRVLEEAAPHLEAIGCFCIGTNQVDLAAAAERGVGVFNAPYSNTRSVVELVIGEIIALARRLPEKTHRPQQARPKNHQPHRPRRRPQARLEAAAASSMSAHRTPIRSIPSARLLVHHGSSSPISSTRWSVRTRPWSLSRSSQRRSRSQMTGSTTRSRFATG